MAFMAYQSNGNTPVSEVLLHTCSGTNGLSTLQATVGHHRIMKRTVVWLTVAQTKALAGISKRTLAPISALVRQAVNEFLQTKQRRKPSANRKD